jgi:glycosyltransferase involved in cell wall biosynthesis
VTKAPEVSTVIPTRDRPELLAKTLRSALSQRDVAFEVIVVDDGSRDDVASAVGAARDRRVRVISHVRSNGVSAARNSGIEAAHGRWIAFLDDDDLWAPTKLARQLRAATDAGSGWAYVGAVKIDDADRVVGGTPPPTPRDVMARLPRWSVIPGGCSGVIVRRDVLDRTGGFDHRFTNLADWDLWIRLARSGSPAQDGDPLVGYRLHDAQSSLDVALILREAEILERKYGIEVDRGSLHHYLAHKCLLAGRQREAMSHFVRAAISGEAPEVMRSAWSLLRDRIRRRFPSIPAPPPTAYAAWRREATGWLSELSASFPKVQDG